MPKCHKLHGAPFQDDEDISGKLQTINDTFEERAPLRNVLAAVSDTLGLGVVLTPCARSTEAEKEGPSVSAALQDGEHTDGHNDDSDQMSSDDMEEDDDDAWNAAERDSKDLIVRL